MQRNLKKTIVFVSHDLDEAIHLGGRIVLMKDGAIVQIGGPEEILLQPASDYVRRFVEHIDVSSVLSVGRLADRRLPCLRPQQSLEEARLAVAASEAASWFILDADGRAVGRVTREALAGRAGSVAEAMRTAFPGSPPKRRSRRRCRSSSPSATSSPSSARTAATSDR